MKDNFWYDCVPIVSRDDYTAPVNTLRFSGCLVQHCVDMNIADDSVLEPQESFTVSLMRSEGIGNEIQLVPDVAEIFVIDNDGICACIHILSIRDLLFTSEVTFSDFCIGR